MRSFFKLSLTAGALVFMASAMPACGSDDEDPKGGSGGTTGGSGGTDSGSGGTTGGSGGSAGSIDQCSPSPSGGDTCDAGTCTCGTESCPAYKVANLIDLPACCAGGGTKCGAYVSTTVGTLISAPEGCYETGQVGNDDTACPNFQFINPIDQMPAEFAGCCRPDGKCGYAVDISSQNGPNLGCVPVDCSQGGTETSCTPGGSDSGTGGSAGAAGSAGASGSAGSAGAGPGDAAAD